MTTSALRWGTPCTLAPYDADPEDPPHDGSFVITTGGSAYLVVRARLTRSRHPNRYRLECVRWNPAEVPVDAHTVSLSWYPRGRRR